MGNNHKKKIEPWKMIVFGIAVAFIVFMWAKNDIAEICATMPSEQIAPLIATTIAVSLLKVAAIAGVILLIKWIVGKPKTIFGIGIVLFPISIILLSCVLYDRFFSLNFPVLRNLFTNPTLYFILLFVILTIYFVITKGTHTFFKTVTVVVTLISILPLSTMLMLAGGKKVSATNDINNYGIYDKVVRKDLKIFPSEITEDMTPIKYSYYYDWSWDCVYEIYLEVKMTDHSYEELKAKYAESLLDFRFADGYEEFVIHDKLNPEIRNDSYYTSYPNIIKIIFHDAENIVIFEFMYGFDPFDLKNSAYINRFNIDPSTYDSNASK